MIITAMLVWIVDLLTGRSAQVIAVLSVASVGFLLLSGRVPFRRSARVVFGCFLVFSAATIANALTSLAGDGQVTDQPDGPIAMQISAQRPPPDLDPYAGAAVPTQQTGNLLEDQTDDR